MKMHDERTCVVPENIHTPSMEDHWKFLGGRRGGGHGKVFSKGLQTTYKTLKATYDRSEAQKYSWPLR